jgi:hypothetical protein
MRVGNLGIVWNLSLTSIAPELQDILIDLAQAGCSNRLAVCETAAISVDG